MKKKTINVCLPYFSVAETHAGDDSSDAGTDEDENR